MGRRVSGVIGAVITLLVVWMIGRLLQRRQPRKPVLSDSS
jgi:hypothetical protein